MSSLLSISSPEDSTPLSPQLVVKLKLTPSRLRDFPHVSPSAPLSTPSKPASVVADEEKTPLGATSPATAASPIPTPSVASPAPTGPGSPPNLEGKAVNGVVEAVKRGGKRAGGGGGKPGPKKRKLDDGTSMPPSRLGPKSSGGAINAGLRNLDRSGNPCKKWSKTPFTLKSFTGFRFTLGMYDTARSDPTENENSKESLGVPNTNGDHLSNGISPNHNVSMSDAASVASGGSGDIGTPKEASNGVEPMEDVRSTNGDDKEQVNGVSGANTPNGVHASTSEGMLVAPV